MYCFYTWPQQPLGQDLQVHYFKLDHHSLMTLTFDVKYLSFCSIGARWSSGSAFACRSIDPWFESYTGLKWISLGTWNESPRLHSTKVWIDTLRGLCLCKLDMPERRILAAHKTGSEIVALPCKTLNTHVLFLSPSTHQIYDIIFSLSFVIN